MPVILLPVDGKNTKIEEIKKLVPSFDVIFKCPGNIAENILRYHFSSSSEIIETESVSLKFIMDTLRKMDISTALILTSKQNIHEYVDFSFDEEWCCIQKPV